MGPFSGAGVSADAPELLTSSGQWLVLGDLLPQHLSSVTLPTLSPQSFVSPPDGRADGAGEKATPVALWS